MLLLIGSTTAIVFAIIVMFIAMSYRVVVSTNDVHIVQRSKGATSYGAGQTTGNAYYRWPVWIPIIGVRTSNLPLSIFPINLKNYAAYDKGRVPFIVDIMAFFRITNSNTAASRVKSFDELEQQLNGILQSACRSILATSEIESILEGRSEFGERFTKEVDHNLENWGLQSVKNIELMDLRDDPDSHVIQNIMAKKKSLIERQSRIEVAENQRAAQVAEIEATQAVQVRNQQALEQVGIQTAGKEQRIGIASQQAQQAIKEEEKTTAVKQMAVTQINQVRQAEIERDVQVVTADRARQVQIIDAEGTKQKTILVADGNLESAKRHAEGIRVEGEAVGAAEQASLMAPVNSQIALASKISSDAGYQQYLVTIRGIERDEVIGKAQAEALTHADVKVIANTGNAVDGVKDVMDLFTSKGGTQLGAMVEALAQTTAGAAIVKRLNGNSERK